MQSKVWKNAVERAADPNRVQQRIEELRQTSAAPVFKKASAEQAAVLAALFSGSQALSEQLVSHPEWLARLDLENLKFPRQKQGMNREAGSFLKPLLASRDYAAAYRQLREFRHREMLRIAARDLSRLGDLMQIVGEISDLADVCLDAVLRICWEQLTDRFGIPYHQDAENRWQPSAFSVLGLGKLGGRELNYSSDVDVLFVYSEEGFVFKTPPKKSDSGKGMTNHQFFTRLAESFIAEVGRITPEGMLFRIDLRLRPEGNAGPLARSLSSYENYYAQWGQTWERMMLIKARRVAGDEELAAEFLDMAQAFRYPRSLNERVLREISAMKQRIENEVVKAGELERNVKLGRGGIREIEFVAQTLQLLNAGRTPFLQGAQTLPTLQKLVQYKLLADSEAAELAEAYTFLRDIEHRLQMENNQQTHTIPTERKTRERLAALMGFESLRDFERAHKTHTENVRRIYDRLLRTEEAPPKLAFPEALEGAESEWKKILAQHHFRDVDKAFRLVKEFVQGPGYVHTSPRTVELARELLPRLLALCPRADAGERKSPVLSDPDRVLARLDSFISVYGARATLYDLWTSNPSVFELLILLFDRSEFLAETAIRTPDLVDELELSGRLRRQKSSAETLADLRYGINDADQKLWMRRYHQAELMRVGLRDILGLADFEQNLIELSNLADACLQYALEAVLKKNRMSKPPFCIIGMGKLGGHEINYGSDLDIIFVADAKTKDLPKLQKLAIEIMDLLSAKTEHGIVFQTDARLRPDGEKGLLVNTLPAYEDYYRQRAMLWEVQSLTRIRPVAGNFEVGEKFARLAAALTNFSAPDLPLNAYRADWKQEIARMRLRIEKERTPAGKDPLAIKTGCGGLMDAEFLAQIFCLEHGWREPNTLRALERAARENILKKKDAEQLLPSFRELRRIEGILRRWSYEGETELPDDPAPLYRVSVRCGFRNSDEFMAAVKKYRDNIRAVYAKFSGG